MQHVRGGRTFENDDEDEKDAAEDGDSEHLAVESARLVSSPMLCKSKGDVQSAMHETAIQSCLHLHPMWVAVADLSHPSINIQTPICTVYVQKQRI